MTRKTSLTVNGMQTSHEVEPRLLLVHYLRDVLGLTGPHIGCDTSQCGACTVMLNGVAVKSCTILAVQADGGEVLTIEGLGKEDQLHPMAAHQLLQRNPNPSEAEIRWGLEGNLCRCTGYQHIVKAVQYAAGKLASK